MNRKSLVIGLVFSCGIILGSGKAYARDIPSAAPAATLLVTGMESGSGSTVGPGGALYVTEGATGKVLRVDPVTGEVSTFASGLPKSIIGIGGAMDIAFIGKTAYVLVTLVGNDVGGTNNDVDGIYRVDGPESFTVFADIGEFSVQNPPDTDFSVPTGLQYAMESYRGGFLVTDGHHNRVLRVTRYGEVTELITFDNIVPTGLEVSGNKVYMAEAGPVPHLPRTARSSRSGRSHPPPRKWPLAPRSSLMWSSAVVGPLRPLQGAFAAGGDPGSPAQPNTGSLLKVNSDGTFSDPPCRRIEPTNLARVHREHRVRRDPRWGDLEDRSQLNWTIDLN